MMGEIAERLLGNVIMAQAAATVHAVGIIRRDIPPLRTPLEGLKGVKGEFYPRISIGILGVWDNMQGGPNK